MSNHIKIRMASGTWSVRADGAVLGESKRALVLKEGDYPEIIYFPRSDLAMALFDKTEKSTHCPHKGDASYFTISTGSGDLKDAAWTYETPNPDVAEIADHIAFYESDDLTVEEL